MKFYKYYSKHNNYKKKTVFPFFVVFIFNNHDVQWEIFDFDCTLIDIFDILKKRYKIHNFSIEFDCGYVCFKPHNKTIHSITKKLDGADIRVFTDDKITFIE